MQNIKKICLITLLLLFSNCGYKVLDTSKLNNFSFKEIETTGDKRVSFKIKNNLLINSNRNNKNILLQQICWKKILLLQMSLYCMDWFQVSERIK